jgi:hypothetical protein
MLCALNTSISLRYSIKLSSIPFNLYLHEPNTPPGRNCRSSINFFDSLDVSINSSLNAPRIPFLPANTLPICGYFFASMITALAEALITEVTPPD